MKICGTLIAIMLAINFEFYIEMQMYALMSFQRGDDDDVRCDSLR